MSFDPDRVGTFHYLGLEIDAGRGEVGLRYALDGDIEFRERVAVPGVAPATWDEPAAREAARLLFLLAGVSYYKAAAPSRIDLGSTPIRPGEREFLRAFYLEGLGEYAFGNGLDLSGLEIAGGTAAGSPAPWPVGPGTRPLVPFGGGIDSIVTVEALRDRVEEPALFVMGRGGQRFAAIEDAAAVTRLPILRADQHLDPRILRSRELGFRNGHVPVTGVLSAMALLVAALTGRGSVVMSNEWSASIGNVVVGDRTINHQYSKSWSFEVALRDVLRSAYAPPTEYFSLLRPYSELWVARRFARLRAYHDVFRSCNRAFHSDPALRLDHWCGRCDKCCFIDLILAPFVPADDLARVFGGREPLADPELAPRFRTLIGTSADAKPFECVGDVHECRTAVALAAQRDDRAGFPLLHSLAAELPGERAALLDDADRLLAPLGPTHTPDALTPSDQLV